MAEFTSNNSPLKAPHFPFCSTRCVGLHFRVWKRLASFPQALGGSAGQGGAAHPEGAEEGLKTWPDDLPGALVWHPEALRGSALTQAFNYSCSLCPKEQLSSKELGTVSHLAAVTWVPLAYLSVLFLPFHLEDGRAGTIFVGFTRSANPPPPSVTAWAPLSSGNAIVKQDMNSTS